MKKIFLTSLVLFLGIIISALAQEPGIVTSTKPGWHKIGEVTASFRTESESIFVIGADKFKSIKLKVTDAPINIENAMVYYESGKSQEIPVKGTLQSGAETKVFNLDQPTEDIKKVSFTYKSEPSYRGDKAHVELYGLK
jgi:hypothetical protein